MKWLLVVWWCMLGLEARAQVATPTPTVTATPCAKCAYVPPDAYNFIDCGQCPTPLPIAVCVRTMGYSFLSVACPPTSTPTPTRMP